MSKKIKVLHLINHVQDSGAANLLKSQLQYYSDDIEIHLGYLLKDDGIFKNMNFGNIIKFPLSSAKDIFTIFNLIKYILKYKIDIIHTHLIQSSLIGRFVSIFFPKLKVFTTKHSVKYSNPERLVYKLENKTLNFSDAIICISDYVKEYLSKMGIKENKLFRVYNGIDYDYFNSAKPPDYKSNYIGIVAMLVRQKGIDNLLKAFKIVISKYPDAKLEIVGNGPLMSELETLAHKLGISEFVNFSGRVSHKEVREKMSKWRAMVLPSRWEAFGLVIAEANAVGLPVIASNVGAIPELIEDGKNGMIFRAGDVSELAGKIKSIYNDPNLAQKMGQDAKKYSKKFDIKDKVSAKEKLYKELIK